MSVRDFPTFKERLMQTFFQKKISVPNHSLADVMNKIEELRNKYNLDTNWEIGKKPKPGAFSQRYDGVEFKSRGPQDLYGASTTSKS
jgi:hypothetical protein